MIAIEESISCIRVPSPNHFELLTITLDLQNPITLCTVYVPPNSDEAYHNTLINCLRSNQQVKSCGHRWRFQHP